LELFGGNLIMANRKGMTRCDAAVAVVCMVFILANAPAIIAGGRERSKRAACMANMRALTSAWSLYADDNNEKLVNAQIWKVHCGWPIPYYDMGGSAYPVDPSPTSGWTIYVRAGQIGWAHWPHRWNTTKMPWDGSKTAPHAYCGTDAISENCATEKDWQHGIACGGLWRYLRDFKIYRCPITDRGVYISYTMSANMNGHYTAGWCDPIQHRPYRIRGEIKNPASMMLFLDNGRVNSGSWDAMANQMVWQATPPMRHGRGTTLSFVDSHTEYRKWSDRKTWGTTSYNAGGGYWQNPQFPGPQPCNQDLMYMQKCVCGGLGPGAIAPGCTPE
jgi:hypothetical protein